MTIGSKLTYLREKNGWTKTYVANRLGIKTMSTYANWEYDLRQPDADMLVKIAELYGVSVDSLLGRSSLRTLHRDFIEPVQEAVKLLNIKLQRNKISKDEKDLLKELEGYRQRDGDIEPEFVEKARKFLDKEKDIAIRLERFKEEIEDSDGLAFDGEPLSEEAKESLIESMEHIFRQTQRINKKYIPKKYRDDE